MTTRKIRYAIARIRAPILAIVVATASSGPAFADESSFVSGGAFFSQTQRNERAIDPHVFVYDASVAVGTGPERIEHIAGLRNARLNDEPISPIYNAEGKPLGLTLRKWLSARGTLETRTQVDGRVRVIASFRHLVPFGMYTLFAENENATGEKTVRPLDADGSASSFQARADGSTMIVLDTRLHESGDVSIVLLYHSDGKEHGVSRGRLGVNAHEQLAAHLSGA